MGVIKNAQASNSPDLDDLLIHTEDMPQFRAVYDAVETWDDLLVTNLAFLHDKFIPFIYYANFLGAEDEGAHRHALQNLIDLHLYGIFTSNGQGNVCLPMNEIGEEQQRPYLVANIPPAMWPAIKKQLDKLHDIIHYRVQTCEPRYHTIATTFQLSCGPTHCLRVNSSCAPSLILTPAAASCARRLNLRHNGTFSFAVLTLTWLQPAKTLGRPQPTCSRKSG